MGKSGFSFINWKRLIALTLSSDLQISVICVLRDQFDHINPKLTRLPRKLVGQSFADFHPWKNVFLPC